MTDEDYLLCRVRTTGIVEGDFTILEKITDCSIWEENVMNGKNGFIRLKTFQ